jgi:hypothetical protein
MFTTNANEPRQLGQKRLQYAFADGKALPASRSLIVNGELQLALYEWRT